MPSLRAANRCRDFIVKAALSSTDELISPDNSLDVPDLCSPVDLTTQAHRRVKTMDLEVEGIHAVVFPATTGVAIEAKSYWQHTGEIVTSRRGKGRTPSMTFGSTVTLISPPSPPPSFTSSFCCSSKAWRPFRPHNPKVLFICL
jgi:hypothetical protein